jgi:putative PIG3 family NAD(P)H quinone oxidoreductase
MSDFKGYIATESGIELKYFNIRRLKAYEVLIKVKFIGVNHADLLQSQGKYPPPENASPIIGLEVAGEIVELGKSVKGLTLGKNVMALLEGGAYAEYVIADARLCILIPDNMDLTISAATLENFTTIWLNLFVLRKFKRDQIYLIHGGSGGIGTTAIQLIKHFGGEVIVTCGTQEKCEKALKLGASLAINYNSQIFTEEILKKYPKGVDVIFDSIGGVYLESNISILNKKGTLICIGTIGGVKSNINLLSVIKNQLTIKGSVLRTLQLNEKIKLIKEIKYKVLPLIESQKIKPIIWKLFNFLEARKALQALERKEHFGKIILKVE